MNLAGHLRGAVKMRDLPWDVRRAENRIRNDDPVGVTFWKVTNGIRLTGMPAFEDSLKDQQRWQVSEFLANADKGERRVNCFD